MQMMEWKKLLNSKRLGGKPAKFELGRTPFNSDHDKIVFSGAFRRLARKTQVHPLATNDHVHNRLTHSLEVACVGRSLGVRVGHMLQNSQELPEPWRPTDIGDIVEAACLAHDIGNPPFGHTGEEAIKHWFRSAKNTYFSDDLSNEEIADLENFEGNAQGFRILTTSEYHACDGGMRLTYATLATFIKYPWTCLPMTKGYRPRENKFGIYDAEKAYFDEVAEATGLIAQPDGHWFCRHPLTHLVELADDFCYALLDLEDGLEMGILEWDEVFKILQPVFDADKADALKNTLRDLRPGRRPPLLRGKVISTFVEGAAQAFASNRDRVLSGKMENGLLECCPDRIRECITQAKDLARHRIFAHPRKVEIEIGAYSTIATLLEVICEAINDQSVNGKSSGSKSDLVRKLITPSTLQEENETTNALDKMSRYQAMMRAVDFVSGMTDDYATYLAKQFSGMGGVR